MRDPEKNSLYSIVLYLGPGDYHHFHSPTDATITDVVHTTGDLLSVSPSLVTLCPWILSVNERVALIGTHGSEGNFFSMTAVGAYNVGSIRLTLADIDANRGSDATGVSRRVALKQHTGDHLPSSSAGSTREAPSTAVQSEIGAAQNTTSAIAAQPGAMSKPSVLLKRGEHCGVFELGSTVVLIFEEKDDLNWTVMTGEKLKYGKALAR
jgi:phosphatidylserine decarboxylase